MISNEQDTDQVIINAPEGGEQPIEPRRKLYDKLNQKGLYTKTYEDFQKQFGTPEAQSKLRSKLAEKGLYTKDDSSFQAQFFKESAPAEQPKPKINIGKPEYTDFNKAWGLESKTTAPSREEMLAPKEEIPVVSEGHQGVKLAPQKPFVSDREKMKLAAEEGDKVIAGILPELPKTVKKMLHEAKVDELLNQLPQGKPGTDNTKNTELLQRMRTMLPQSVNPVSNEEIDMHLALANENPKLLRETLVQYAKHNPEKAKPVNKAIYALDTEDAPDKYLPQVTKNLEDLDKGNGSYNPITGVFTKELSGWKAFEHGVQKTRKELKDYESISEMSVPEQGAYLESKRQNKNPYAPEMSMGVAGMAGTEGVGMGWTVVPGIASGALANAIPGLQTASPYIAAAVGSAFSGPEYYQREYVNSQEQNFNKFRDQGLSIEEATQKANEVAAFDAMAGVTAATAMNFVGLKSALTTKGALTGSFRKAMQNEVKMFAKEAAPEGLKIGAISAAGQAAKNLNSGEDMWEGVAERAGADILFMGALKAVARGANALTTKSNYRPIINQLAKLPDEELQHNIGKAIVDGHIKQNEVEGILEAVEKQKKLAAKVSPKVINDDIALEIQERIEKVEDYKDQKSKLPAEDSKKEYVDKKIEEKNAEILELEKEGAKKTPVMEGVEILQKKVESNELPGVYKTMVEQDPEGVLKFIADQAQDEIEVNGIRKAPREETEADFGKDLVAKAIEAYPKVKEKQRHTVSTPEIVNVKLKEKPFAFEDFSNLMEEQISQGINSKDTWAIEIPGLSQKEKMAAFKNLKDGKDTAQARILKESLQSQFESGYVDILQNAGGLSRRDRIPIKDWFGLDKKEQSHALKMDDATASIINDNDITLQNIDELKHLFDGFPYTAEDFTAIKSHLEGQSKSSLKAESIAKPSETISIEEPPVIEPPVGDKPETTRLAHADTEEKRADLGLDERTPKEVKHDADLLVDADKKISEGYDVDALVKRGLKGETQSAEEHTILKKYAGSLEAKIDELEPGTPEFEKIKNELKDIYTASEMSGSRLGLDFRARREPVIREYGLADMLRRKQEAMAVEGLTVEQQKEVKTKAENVKKSETKIKDKGKAVADAIRKLKINKGDNLQSNLFSIPVAVYDGAITLIANSVEAGANLADAIALGVKHIKENGGFKDKAEENRFIGYVQHGTTQESTLKRFKARTQKAIETIRQKTADKDFSKPEKTPLELDKEALDLRVELEDAKHQFDIEVYKDEMERRTKWEKVLGHGKKLLGTMKGAVAGIDDSWIGVQGMYALLANPQHAPHVLKEHVLDAFSEKRFNRKLAEIHNSAFFDLMKQSDLQILEPQSLVAKMKEEVMADTYANDKLMIGGKNYNPSQVLKPFERAFTSLGNNLRVKMFMEQAAPLLAEGKTFQSHPEEFNSIARIANEATGRGKLPEFLEAGSKYITPIIWSPKLLASTVNMLGINDAARILTGQKGGYYRSLTPRQRGYAVRQLAAGVGVGVTTMAAAAYAKSQGADVDIDYDPFSVTFGNIRYGNKTLNVFGRMSPVIKAIFQAGGGKRDTPRGTQDLDNPKFGGNDRGDILGRFFRGKMTPAAGVSYDYILNAQKDSFTGEELTLIDALKKTTLPISFQNDFLKHLKEDGTAYLLTDFLPNFVGLNVKDQRDFDKKKVNSKPQKPIKQKRPERPERPKRPERN